MPRLARSAGAIKTKEKLNTRKGSTDAVHLPTTLLEIFERWGLQRDPPLSRSEAIDLILRNYIKILGLK